MTQPATPVVRRPAVDDRFAGRAVWLPILVIAPFVILLVCASPHSDDFCFAASWRDRGLIAMVGDLYVNFQGRLFSFVATIVPFWLHYMLGVDLLVAFRAFCAAALGAAIALALWGANAILPGCPKSIRLLLGFLTAAVLVAGSPQPEDLFYWATGIGFYTIPALVTLGMMIWLHRQVQRKAPIGPAAVGLLMAGGMLIATATEISGPVLLAVVLGSLLHRWLVDAPRQPVAHALILSAIAVGVAIVVLAPGNALRLRVMGTDQGMALRMLAGLPLTVGHVAQFLSRRLTNPAVLAWLVCLLVLPRSRDAPPAVGASPAVWMPLATAMIAIYGSLWIGQVATGHLLEQRALNYLHFVLVGGLGASAVAASAAFGPRIRAIVGERWPRLDGRKLAVAALLLMIATPHFLQAVQTLAHLVPLYRAVEARFALLGGGKAPGAPIADRDLVLPAPPIADLWFGDPAGEDPGAWRNVCLARYVGVRSVRIESRRPASD